MTGGPLVVVVTGAGGPAGQATVHRLTRDGHTVVGVDVSEERLAAVRADAGPGRFEPLVLDLLDEAAVRSLAERVEAENGRVDGVLHLVGGWRGGKTFADNTAGDWALLHDLLVRTLQHVSLAFHDALLRGGRGRFAVVSATAAQKPTAGNAAYAAAKAAAEAWTLALADSFRKAESGRKDDPQPQRTAAVVLVVKALATAAARAERPDFAFPGWTDVDDLAAAATDLFTADAAGLNGRRLPLDG